MFTTGIPKKHYSIFKTRCRERYALKAKGLRIVFVPLCGCLGHLSRNEAMVREVI